MTPEPSIHPCPDRACPGDIELAPYATSTEVASCPACGREWDVGDIWRARRSQPAQRPIRFHDAGLARYYQEETTDDLSPGQSAKLDLHRYLYLWHLLEDHPDIRLGTAIRRATQEIKA